ncbi:restriction endonuclease subunit S [Rhizobium ruizarguesonis]
MTDWRETTLGQFVSLQRGHDLPTEQRRAGSVPVMGSFGITGWHDQARAPGPGVTVGRSGASVGVVSYSDCDYWPLNTCLFATNFHGNNPRFVYYFLQTLDLAAHNSGSAQPSLNRNYISPIKIFVPDPGIQNNIVNLLGSLDDKIELNRRMNETLEAMAQAVFRDWFVDFGPTRRKLEGATDPFAIMGGLVQDAERAQALADLFPATLGNDGLPDGWSWGAIGQLLQQHTASLSPASFADETFAHFSLPAYDSARYPVLQLGSEILSNKTLLPSDAVLVSKLNPEIPRVWMPPEKPTYRAISSTEFLVFTPKGGSSQHYLYCLFREAGMRQKLQGLVTGTSKSHQRVSPKALTQLESVVPERELVECCTQMSAPFLKRVQQIQEENRTLAATRDLLLPKLMSGEIRLSEADDLLEAAQ